MLWKWKLGIKQERRRAKEGRNHQERRRAKERRNHQERRRAEEGRNQTRINENQWGIMELGHNSI